MSHRLQIPALWEREFEKHCIEKDQESAKTHRNESVVVSRQREKGKVTLDGKRKRHGNQKEILRQAEHSRKAGSQRYSGEQGRIPSRRCTVRCV